MKRFIVLLLLLAGAWCSPAMAHAQLERSLPAAGAVLHQAPAAITLYFDAELEPAFTHVAVTNAQGEPVSRGEADFASGGPKSVTVKLATLAKGVYRVYWDVVSRDGHHATGEFTFTVQ